MNVKSHEVKKQGYWLRTIGDAARNWTSIRKSCRQRRLKESQFYWWQRKLKVSHQERNKPVVQGRAASVALVFSPSLWRGTASAVVSSRMSPEWVRGRVARVRRWRKFR